MTATMATKFQGSFPALITPFTSSGVVDFDRFQKFVDWQIKEGSHGLVPAGTTGESPTLTHEDHKLVIKLCVEVAAGRVPVVAGAGSNSTREAIALSTDAESSGADALLIVTPYYNKPSQEALIQHFKAIHDATRLPIFIYNIPGRSVVDMSVDTMKKISQLERIIGVKDATGDLSRVALQRTVIGEGFIQLSGEDATAVGFNAMGGKGVISVTANIAPKLVSLQQEALLKGDMVEALRLQDILTPLHEVMFMEPSPAPAKYIASLLGICENRLRAPLLPMSEPGKALAASLVSRIGLEPVNF